VTSWFGISRILGTIAIDGVVLGSDLVIWYSIILSDFRTLKFIVGFF
jgi:hypothetical protein